MDGVDGHARRMSPSLLSRFEMKCNRSPDRLSGGLMNIYLRFAAFQSGHKRFSWKLALVISECLSGWMAIFNIEIIPTRREMKW